MKTAKLRKVITNNKNIGNDGLEKLKLSSYRVPEGRGKEAVWNTIFEKIENEQRIRVLPLWSAALKVAAVLVAVLLIGSLTWITIFGRTNIYCPAGQHLLVNLPDGSKVNLNSETKLSYNKYYWQFSRVVELDGEALFTVKKGKSFSVQTGVVTTQVLGTTFNIYARNNEVKVSCIEGSVAVIHSLTKQKVLLKPSQKTALNDGELKKPTEATKIEMAIWTKGEFYFVNQELKKVFEELERQFNVKIMLASSSEKRVYSGVFFNNNLTEALDLICLPMQLEWKKVNGTILITEK